MAEGLEVVGQDSWSTVLESDVPVLVDFYADWCGPCRAIGPTLEELSQEYAGKARIVKVDVDKDGELANQYGIRSIPALLIFKGGTVADMTVGALSKTALTEKLDDVIG